MEKTFKFRYYLRAVFSVGSSRLNGRLFGVISFFGKKATKEPA